jgi:hypothetical protein
MPVPSRVSKRFSKGNAALIARTKNTVSDAVKMCSCFSQLLSVEAMENLEI